MNLIEKELFHRKMKKVPTYILEDMVKLSEEEYNLLGEPIVIKSTSDFYICNCTDGGKITEYKCTRCSGYRY